MGEASWKKDCVVKIKAVRFSQAKKEVFLPALKAPKRPPIEKEAPIHEISSSSNPRPPKV